MSGSGPLIEPTADPVPGLRAPGAPEWLVVFGPGDFHAFNPSCTTHIAREFHRRGSRVLWINPIPIGSPSVRSAGGRRRVLLRLRSYLRPLRRVAPGFYTLSVIGRASVRDAALAPGTRALLRSQLRAALRWLGVRRALTWIETPSAVFGLDLIAGQKVYQLSDKYELSRYASLEMAAWLAEASQRLVRDCDLVTCTARTLWRELRPVRSDTLYLPHAVDLDLFTRRPGPPPDDIANLPPPIIGYFGTLTVSNNQALLAECAARHPEWSIVLIGRITGGDWARMQALPNVHFLGFKPLEQIPAYGSCFDVAVMDWIVDDWMHYAHPLKAREYLALGLPVVSTPLPEVVESYDGLVSIAADPDSFVTQAERALAENSPEQAARRRAWAARHTWRGYVDTVLDRLGGGEPEPVS